MENLVPNTDKEVSVKENKEQKNLKMFLLGLGGVVLAALVLSIAVGVYRAYAKGATDIFTVTVAKVLRLPVMKINGEVVRYSEFADDLKAIKTMRDYEKANNGQNANLTDEQMSDQVLWRLANNILVHEGALTYNLKVEEDDIDRLKTQLLQNFKSTDELNAELLKRYGWDLATYEKKVMDTFVLQSKLSDALATDAKLKDGVKAQAQSVLDQIKAGADFAEMAKKYGQDGTKDNGGDLGFFAKGEMVPAFEAAAFALKPGEVTPQLVETEYGYHIIKMEEKKTAKVKDDKGKMVDQEQIRVRHILFRAPAVDTYLDGLARKAAIHLYVKIHNPFAELLTK
jgi:parvulin-like peptidyl-prolyl isomerase